MCLQGELEHITLQFLRWNGTLNSAINNTFIYTMNNAVTAQELKTKGASVLKKKTGEMGEAFITIRGKKSYVVLTIDKYNFLRECELDVALKESEADLAGGKFRTQTVDEHIKDIKDV